MKFLIAVFLIYTSLLPAKNSCLHVNHLNHPLGMFAVFNYVMGVLFEYERHSYLGLEVNFEKSGLYYQPSLGPNWWQYYCEPLSLGVVNGCNIKTFNIKEFEYYAYLVEFSLNRWQVANLIQKYFKIKAPIQKKIDRFVQENFTGYSVIGVHYRGTDKILEAPRVGYHEMAEQVQQYIAKNKLEKYKIFVATDEAKFIEYMKNQFAGSVIVYSTLHSNDGSALHITCSQNYLKGEEALIDSVLLSKTDYLVRTSSNLSLWSTYFNPSISFITLNSRYIR